MALLGLLPDRLSIMGLADWFGLAIGVTIGASIGAMVFPTIESNFSKKGA